MLIDGYEQYQPNDSEVVDITPDSSSEDKTDLLRADKCMSALQHLNDFCLLASR